MLLFILVSTVRQWHGLFAAGGYDLLWPVVWIRWLPWSGVGVGLVLCSFCLGCLAAAFFPERRGARALAFLGVFEFVALSNSFGKIQHSFHLLVFTSLFLVFLPGRPDHRRHRRVAERSFLLAFWSCQAIILLSYTMSGCGKVLFAFGQISRGEPNIFLPTALARYVADRLLQTNSKSALGGVFIEYYWLGWPLMLGMLYLEFFAIWAAFRPGIQRFWAFGLILFHLGTHFIMGISFPRNVLLLALFFLTLPARGGPGARLSWRERLSELPLFGCLHPESYLSRRFGRKVSATPERQEELDSSGTSSGS